MGHVSPCSLVNIAETYELQAADRSLLVMPLFHVHGLMAGVTPVPKILALTADDTLLHVNAFMRALQM